MRPIKSVVAVTGIALSVVTACGSEVGDNVPSFTCCTEFKPGEAVDVSISANVQAQVAAQAASDLAGIATASVSDITMACRSLATDLDASPAKVVAAEQKAGVEKMDAWCSLAAESIGRMKAQAGGSLTVNVAKPKCSASISAKANCQAKCSGSASCDLKANPPKCTGGSLEVACKGECTAKGDVALKCEGKCTGNCSGSCTATGGVECKGKCEGTCKASANGGGTGIQADGTCDGSCEGTCDVTAPGAKCEGSCQGTCDATCTGTAEAAVKCDGDCNADYEPLKCEGGKLEGGCQVDAKCDANCDASVAAKAECTPPRIEIAFSGASNVEAVAKLKATFEANLPAVFAIGSRLEGAIDLAKSVYGNVETIADIKPMCVVSVAFAAGVAVEDMTASIKASDRIVTAAR